MRSKNLLTFVLMFALGVLPGNALAGTISGVINFSGDAPEPDEIEMAADPACMAIHPDGVDSESVIVNDNNTLKNVFVYVKEGLSGHFDTPTDTVTLDQKGCMYQPHVFGMQTGQTLELLNSDSTLHNVHGMPKVAKEFNIGMPIPGMKLNKQFADSETPMKFKCDVHPWMSAYAFVLPHPFFNVSGDDGSFSIADLPAGTYVVEAWHETYGTKTQNVTVDEGGTATVDFAYSA